MQHPSDSIFAAHIRRQQLEHRARDMPLVTRVERDTKRYAPPRAAWPDTTWSKVRRAIGPAGPMLAGLALGLAFVLAVLGAWVVWS